MTIASQTAQEVLAKTGEIKLTPLGMHGTGMDGRESMGRMMWLMILFWLLILLALGGGVYWVFTRLLGGSSENDARAGNPSKEALSALNERDARDEIDDQEYMKRKRKITDESE